MHTHIHILTHPCTRHILVFTKCSSLCPTPNTHTQGSSLSHIRTSHDQKYPYLSVPGFHANSQLLSGSNSLCKRQAFRALKFNVTSPLWKPPACGQAPGSHGVIPLSEGLLEGYTCWLSNLFRFWRKCQPSHLAKSGLGYGKPNIKEKK